MPEHAWSGGIARPHIAGGYVDIAGRPQVHPSVLDGRFVVLAEPEPSCNVSHFTGHRDPG